MIRRERPSARLPWLMALGEGRANVSRDRVGWSDPGDHAKAAVNYVGYRIDYSETMDDGERRYPIAHIATTGGASTLDASAIQLCAVPNLVVPEGRPVLDWIDQIDLADDALATVEAVRRYFPDAALCVEADRGPDAGGLLRVTVFPDGTAPEAEDEALERFDEEWLLEQRHRLRSRINVHLA